MWSDSMDRKAFFALAALALSHPIELLAQEHADTRVLVESDCADDLIGKRMIYEVKEGIRRSTWLKLSDSPGQGEFIVHFKCLAPSKDTVGATIYSTVVNEDAFPHENYLTQLIGLCGTGRESTCARSIVATLDEFLADYQRRQRDAEEATNRMIQETIENMRKPPKP